MTIRAAKVLEKCDIIVGYTVYVDLIADHFAGKEMRSNCDAPGRRNAAEWLLKKFMKGKG